jgi:hypothetical protein
MKTETEFHEGPPPYPGWWLASVKTFVNETSNMWGFWNGSTWSIFCSKDMTANTAGNRAGCVGSFGGDFRHIIWSNYYPENARVPRIDPRVPVREPRRIWVNVYKSGSLGGAHLQESSAEFYASGSAVPTEFIEVLK